MSSRRLVFVCALLLAIVGSASVPEEAGAQDDARAGESATRDPAYVRIPGTRVSLVRPEGFIKSHRLSGMISLNGDVTIQVQELPRPFAEARATYDQKGFEAMGNVPVAHQAVEVDGRTGDLVLAVRQDGGREFAVWFLMFGDEESTVLVRATAPKERAETIHEVMLATLKSTRWDPNLEFDPYEGLPFAMPGDHRLKVAKRLGVNLTFTRDGDSPVKTREDPIFVAAYVEGAVAEPDREGFCQAQLGVTALVTEIDVRGSGPIELDGLDGCEAVGYAKDPESEKWLVLYEAALFDITGYYSFSGRVGTSLQYRFLTSFGELTRSFRRRE